MSFKEIKNIISKEESSLLSINNINNELNLNYINILKNDKRKNVISLGISLEKKINNLKLEIKRVEKLYEFDRSFGNDILIAGVDEVGRGPLAGPIAASAVILKLDYENVQDLILGIKDSKKLSETKRQALSTKIKQQALAFSIAIIDADDIDRRGIAWCNNEVFKIAVKGLKCRPDFILSDGYPIKDFNIKSTGIVKGDNKSASIACASILAKVYRDDLMKEYAKIYGNYGFEKNAGYGTQKHIEAIKKHGPCEIHRTYFLSNII
ncbi:MAG: ribonuclease HII [Clostridiaceae bacterium]